MNKLKAKKQIIKKAHHKFNLLIFLFTSLLSINSDLANAQNNDKASAMVVKEKVINVKEREENLAAVTEFVKTTATQVATILNSKIATELQLEKLTSLFNNVVDYEWMGKFVIASFWRGITPQQQEKYLENYKKYLANSYVKHFQDYNGQKFNVKSIKEIGENQYLVVVTVADKSGNASPIDISYRLKLYAVDTIRIIDIIAENLSLLATQRQDFEAVIKQSGIDHLIVNLAQNTTNKK